CETSTNRTDTHDYDAVIFHMRSWNPNDLPKRRTPQQRYLFWLLESAGWPEYLNTSQLGNFFNWTLTYRWDSDMVMPYGYQLMSVQKMNYAAGKTKMAAWMVSNCGSHSNRKEMVSLLQKYIQVDVYGACGPLKCPKEVGVDNSSEDCRDMAGQNYKFYMALENSLCRDYISEKFFGMLQRPVIPVVFGLHNHYDQMAPAHSFINAAKFENMRQLADYLILLDRNDTLYNEYFWWKPHFESRYKQKDVNIGMCHLCASLHNKDMPPKVYANMTQWWDEQSFCINSPPIS
ncbi:hypothetical protein DAPPUDRAFT_64409, partial [Daphnia pulex]